RRRHTRFSRDWSSDVCSSDLPLDAASTNNVPMIGPVQEKDTNAKLNAMKNNPNNPPLSDCASILLTKELGSVSSKAPKKEAAKTTNIKKNRKLNMPFVERAFRASEPKAMVMSIPSATYMTMIKSPYKSACDIPFAREPPFLVKKLTVSGTIGKMQGIMKAANPPSNPAMKIPQRDCPPSALASTDCTGESIAGLAAVSLPDVPSSKIRSSGISNRESLPVEADSSSA